MPNYNQKIIDIFNVISKENDNFMPYTGVLAGEMGLSVTLLKYAEHFNESFFQRQGIKIIERIFEEIEHGKRYVFSFCSGLAGFGWGLDYLNKEKLIDVDINMLLEDVDDVLIHSLSSEMQRNNYDFLHEALGILFYFIARVKNNVTLLPILKKAVLQLYESREKQSNGAIKWLSMIDHKKQKKGYNISLSHGMSSIAVILSKLYVIKGVEQKMVKDLLRGCVYYILEQEIDKDKYGSYFPTFSIESSEQIQGSRLAWCYGDLGIAMALWQTGAVLQKETRKNKALEVLLFAAEKRRNLEKNSVVDADLCHGSAGIAHIFYRIWWNTRMPEFKNAADYWFEQTLRMAKFEDGLAGYKTWGGTNEGWINESNLLVGIAGIGLAMFTYYHEIEPTWDECLLLS